MKHIIMLVLSLSFASLAFCEEKKEKTPSATDNAINFIVKKAEKYSDAAEGAIAKAVDVAQKEAPEVIKEFLAWRFWKNLIIPAFFLVVSVFAVRGLSKAVKIKPKGYEEEMIQGTLAVFYSVVSVVSIFSVAITIPGVLDAIQIFVAPRIYLIEEATKLVK